MAGKRKQPEGPGPEQKSDLDFAVRDEGTVWVFTPQSDRARRLVGEVGLEDWRRVGEGFALDHRPARELVAHLQAAGYAVGRDRGPAPAAQAGIPREARGSFFCATVEGAGGRAGGYQTKLEWEGGFLRLSEADVGSLRSLMGQAEVVGQVLGAAAQAIRLTGQPSPELAPFGPAVGDFCVLFDQVRFSEQGVVCRAGVAHRTGGPLFNIDRSTARELDSVLSQAQEIHAHLRAGLTRQDFQRNPDPQQDAGGEGRQYLKEDGLADKAAEPRPEPSKDRKR